MTARAEPGTPEAGEARDRHPAGPEWRADALARSRHSRLDEEIRQPAGDDDPQRAEELCADLCRNLLGDFAPALLLLRRDDRRRAQALAAYAHTLFDFARQHGVEGEKLAQINRWEFTLELALSGQAVGQPIFVAMARQHGRRPWPQEALDEISAAARRRVTRPRPASAREAEDAAERLARAVGAGLLEAPLAADVSAFAGALVRLHALQNLGPELAQNRCPLPAGELAESPGDPALVLAAARRECERLRRRLLAAPRGLLDLPTRYRRAAVFALLAALRLLSLIEDGDADLLRRPPHLGLLSRLGLLARARWFRIG